MRFPRSAAAIAVVTGCALVPATASAATRTVFVGTPPSIVKTLNEKYSADANAFFPSSLTIHVNDTVAFAPVGFHDVDVPAKGGKAVAAIGPTGKTLAGEKDAAGVDFWFNGQPQLGFTAPMLAMQFGKTVTYNGSKAVISGLPLSDKPKPFNVKFTKKGTFTYYCDLHPGMKAKVHVVAPKSKADSTKAVKSAVAKQSAAAIKTAKGFAKRKAPANTILAGLHGSGGVELLGFAPSKLAVKVGDTVTFQMDANSNEVHTASTGPGNADDSKTYLGQVASGIGESPEFTGQSTYPSDPPPAGAATLVPALHGNGFWSSGVMDASSASPIPASNAVKFGAPGTYDFYCLIHTFMKATVTVS